MKGIKNLKIAVAGSSDGDIVGTTKKKVLKIKAFGGLTQISISQFLCREGSRDAKSCSKGLLLGCSI